MKNIRPNVGIPHFSPRIRQIRASGYDIFRALDDIIDNAIDVSKNIIINFREDTYGQLYAIEISDDSENGFVNILENGSNNPFNMAHIRGGHTDDNVTSEFGTGMKQAAIASCDRFNVVTRVNHGNDHTEFYKIDFDFNDMANRENAEDSYQYSFFDVVTEGSYKQIHKHFKTGSTLELSNLTQMTKINLNELYNGYGVDKYAKTYYEAIKYHISVTYGEAIFNNKFKISVGRNGSNFEEINYCIDYDIFFKNGECLYRMIKHEIYCKIQGNEIKYILIKQTRENTVRYFKSKVGEKLNIDKNKIDREQFNENIEESHIYKLEIMSTCIDNIKMFENYQIINGRNKIFINRNQRNYSVVSYKELADGYSNGIYSLLNYASKTLNSFLGVTFNKDINTLVSNQLIDLIKDLQQLIQRKQGYLGKYRKENPPIPIPPSPVRSRTPSPVRVRTPSPVRSRTPSPVRVRTPSPVRSRTPLPITDDSETDSDSDGSSDISVNESGISGSVLSNILLNYVDTIDNDINYNLDDFITNIRIRILSAVDNTQTVNKGNNITL